MNKFELFQEMDRLLLRNSVRLRSNLELQRESWKERTETRVVTAAESRNVSPPSNYLTDEEIEILQHFLNQSKKLLSKHRKERNSKEITSQS